MTAVAYAHPTIGRFAIADGMLHIGGIPVSLSAPVPPGSSPTSACLPRTEIGDLVAVFQAGAHG